MNIDAATEALCEYAEMSPRRLTDDDKIAMAGYEAMAEGHVLIDLAQVMSAAGTDDKGFPKLAVGRADLTAVSVEMHSDGAAVFFTTDGRGYQTYWTYNRGKTDQTKDTRNVFLPIGTFGHIPRDRYAVREAKALVPRIPPQYRPPVSRLAEHYILWEAVWTPQVPVDPYLLKPIGGYIYAVVAEWDLTPLEQAVMRSQLAKNSIW